VLARSPHALLPRFGHSEERQRAAGLTQVESEVAGYLAGIAVSIGGTLNEDVRQALCILHPSTECLELHQGVSRYEVQLRDELPILLADLPLRIDRREEQVEEPVCEVSIPVWYRSEALLVARFDIVLDEVFPGFRVSRRVQSDRLLKRAHGPSPTVVRVRASLVPQKVTVVKPGLPAMRVLAQRALIQGKYLPLSARRRLGIAIPPALRHENS
jgi:hypothetical protein